MTAAELAQKFHEAYERLAPSFGYKTREASAKPWADVPDNNKRLMTATAAEILRATIDAERARADAADGAHRRLAAAGRCEGAGAIW
jgi:hypothetical protein